MSEESRGNSNDRELFEFYLEHGYFPDDLKENLKNKKVKKNIPISRGNKNNISKTEKYYNDCSEEDREMFLNAVKNLDCSNHIKNHYNNCTDKNYRDKNVRLKFKPNIKNAKPEDILDLHGLTRERALNCVKKFIFDSKKNNLKVVLIIHGKGFRSENKISVLKDLVEYYIATEGKYYIKYSVEAPERLGGRGAKLIYLHNKE